MFPSNPTTLLLVVFLMLASLTACQTGENNTLSSSNKSEVLPTQTNIPFSNKEPDRFQTEIVVSTIIDSEKIERKYFVARRNKKRLTVFNFGDENETAILQIDNKSFVIRRKDKSFSERGSNLPTSAEDELQNFLTTKWLSEKRKVEFEKIGSENNQTTYRVKFEDSKNSEILIYVDEKLKLPIKQEFFSIFEDERIMTLSVELRNFRLEAEEKLFNLPKNDNRKMGRINK